MEECLLSTTLRSLTIDGCFLHDDDGDMWIPFKGQTPLEELYLHDCNLNFRSLSRMLALPRGLKRLYLDQTENTHHELAPSNTHPSSMIEWIQDVLTLQKHSLEHLETKDFFEPFQDAEMADFEEFEKLETIELRRWDVGYTYKRTWGSSIQGNLKWTRTHVPRT